MGNVFEEVVKEYRLFKNRDVLSPHYLPSELPFREEEIRELSQKIAPVLSGRKPENVFIYGKTGTGKTAVTKKVLSDLNDYARSHNIPAMGIYVNGMRESEHSVLLKLVRHLDPSRDLIGYSTSAVYDKLLELIDGRGLRLVVALDEIDMIKRLRDLIYRLNRANDELERGSISIIGISNNPTFKEQLDARTRSTLCEVELVFPPYNAEQLRIILEQRAQEAFKEGAVAPEAISLAAALAAKHSGDARYALQLLLRAGDIAEEEGAPRVEREHVERARQLVEEEIVYEMVASLPEQHRAVLMALASLKLGKKGVSSFGGEKVVTSGLLYSYYRKVAEDHVLTPVSDRQFREYLNELETYGIISVKTAGKGFRGNTRIVDLNVDPAKLLAVVRRSL
ncbi:MAG: AAA family ATPase [Candidatus Diapherotrites archaeon]|nr:AAA family ATPase [Candidatus Diapherotrites archaeon]